jgi:hypothetical protein
MRIKKMIKDLDKKHPQYLKSPTYSKFALPGAVALLSDPKHVHVLPFPLGRMETPARFKLDEKRIWQYMGREKFAEFLSELQLVQRIPSYAKLWVYGTRGYGKSHLLAAMVCYLTALGKRVIYIPDCRLCVANPTAYLKTAMLFAWTDKATQKKILTLNTEDKIKEFLEMKPDVIYVIDQMNELSEARPVNKKKARLADLIETLTAGHKAILGASANYHEYLNRQVTENYDRTMWVYGGFTPVCLNIG